MTWTGRGTIKGGTIVPSEPLGMPEGAEVAIRVDSVDAAAVGSTEHGQQFRGLPFFGMWSDREDMADGGAWVRKEREQWEQRATRRG